MLFINIDSVDTACKLSNICTKYKDNAGIDVICGRQIIDGCSVLGVVALVGRTVQVEMRAKSEELMNRFSDAVCEIGGFKSGG